MDNGSQSLHEYFIQQHKAGEKISLYLLDKLTISHSVATGDNHIGWNTSNASGEALRPKLTIDYTPGEVVGTEFNAGSIEVNAGNVTSERDSE